MNEKESALTREREFRQALIRVGGDLNKRLIRIGGEQNQALMRVGRECNHRDKKKYMPERDSIDGERLSPDHETFLPNHELQGIIPL